MTSYLTESFDGSNPRTVPITAPLSAEQVRAARLTVARESLGVDDCRELLDMLGLLHPADDREGLK